MALEARIIAVRASAIDRARSDGVDGAGATRISYLFAPYTDDRTVARGAQHKRGAVRRDNPVIRIQPAEKGELVHMPDAKPRSGNLVRAQRWFNPQFLPDPECEPVALQRAIDLLGKGGQA